MYLLQQTLFWIGTFLAFYLLLITGLNYLPPAQPLPTEFVNGIHLMFQYLRGLNFLVPIDQIFAALLVVLSYIAFVWIFEIVLWVIHMYRGLRS